MSEEKPSKQDRIKIYQPEIEKGINTEREGFNKLHYPDAERSVKEGYQPIRDITSTPPDGGSGVPDKEE